MLKWHYETNHKHYESVGCPAQPSIICQLPNLALRLQNFENPRSNIKSCLEGIYNLRHPSSSDLPFRRTLPKKKKTLTDKSKWRIPQEGQQRRDCSFMNNRYAIVVMYTEQTNKSLFQQPVRAGVSRIRRAGLTSIPSHQRRVCAHM